jgi:hypothetical protein
VLTTTRITDAMQANVNRPTGKIFALALLPSPYAERRL